MMTEVPAKLPKAELHVHLEGTLTPELAQQLATRNNMPLPDGIFNDKGDYNWTTFPEFLNSYDAASSVIRTAQDYMDVTYEYLASIAREGAIYAELTLGPDIPAMHGMDYTTYLQAVAEGVEKAHAEFGIEARFIICMIRHMGPDVAVRLMRTVADCPHHLVVGVGLAGNELMHTPADFTEGFRIAQELGLGCTAHAGEVAGADSVKDTIEALPVTRIGHGVRSIEDPSVIALLQQKGVTLEVCPGSNIALSVYSSFDAYPLRALYDAGVVGSLNADDPPFFWTTLAKEYTIAAERFGFTEAELLGITRRAVETSFADEATKQALLSKVDAYSIAA